MHIGACESLSPPPQNSCPNTFINREIQLLQLWDNLPMDANAGLNGGDYNPKCKDLPVFT